MSKARFLINRCRRVLNEFLRLERQACLDDLPGRPPAYDS